jgi:hypothetical protein
MMHSVGRITFRVMPGLDPGIHDADVPPGFLATQIKTVKATQFGKFDRQDEGTGSPDMGSCRPKARFSAGR